MKTIGRIFVLFLFFYLLTACSEDTTEKALQQMDQGLQSNQTLDNASFQKEIKYGDQTIGGSEGIFVRGDNDYDWFVTDQGGQGTPLQERVHRDGETFGRIIPADSSQPSSWEKSTESALDIREIIAPLLQVEADLQRNWIEKAEINEKEDEIEIIFHMSSNYVTKLIEDARKDLETNLQELKETNDETGQIEAIQMQIQMLEDQEYSDPKMLISLDQAGYLVSFSQNYSLQLPNADAVDVWISAELTDYNIEDPYSSFPDVGT